MSATPHEKIVARMARIDSMPKEIRELIHEFGLTVVQAFLDQKVTKPEAIRHLIDQVRTGSVEPGTGNGGMGYVSSGRRMCLVPAEPTPAMIEISMATVTTFDPTIDKYEKHRRRLRAAIKAGTSHFL